MCWGGLSGLLAHVRDTILLDKDDLTDDVINEIVAKYPLSKSSIKYLFTLYDEFDEELSEIRAENNTLKERIKQLESKEDIIKGKDIEKLQNELKTLENENKELKEKINLLKSEKVELEKDYQELNDELRQYQVDIEHYKLFFETNGLCAMFYNAFLRKMGR